MAKRKILITGGAGFIGSHLVRHFVKSYPHVEIFNLDKLTYSGNLENLTDIEKAPNYTFLKEDINDSKSVEQLFRTHHFTDILHLAAESHVDRSIIGPMDFVMTNVVGTTHLLNAAKKYWLSWGVEGRFIHVSTDEVYGSLGPKGHFVEESPLQPNSPYSASKASSDLLARSYFRTWGLPVIITHCSNNYGPNQFPEKLIPLCIYNICRDKDIPVYGKGENIRDWLYVEDHVLALDLIFRKGEPGEVYNIGASNEWRNIDLIRLVCRMMDERLGKARGVSERLITFVSDRLGHDERYAIDCTKIQRELHWTPKTPFEEGMAQTIDWYLEHTEWVEDVTSGEYQHYYEKQYAH